MKSKLYEVDIEDMIWENIQNDNGRIILANRGLSTLEDLSDGDESFFFRTYRQPILGSYGRPDIVTIQRGEQVFHKEPEPFIQVTIYELKAVSYQRDYLQQLCGYVAGFEHLYRKHPNTIPSHAIDITGVLICKDFPESTSDYTLNYIDNISCYSFDFCLVNGIKFNTENIYWSKIKPGFNEEMELFQALNQNQKED